MLQFIVTTIFLLSVGAILYVSVRTLPRIDDSLAAEKKGAWERWLTSGLPEKADKAFNGFLSKFLRRVKIVLLKADNAVTGRLARIKTENGSSQKQGIDFKAIKEDGGKEEGAI